MRGHWILIAASLFASTWAKANDPVHLGVASCASSVCHGAASVAEGSNIMQNEFVIWQEYDPHAKAYATLLTAESQRISAKLGLGRAEEAPACLVCHADYVPEHRRGDKFQLSDGVGCEACHGGAENWLAGHTAKDVSRAHNIEMGMIPTEQPVVRAQLCLSCHMGDKNRPMTHQIMGAGHPRLSFELDTFTWLNPHYVVDDDYIQRKGEWDGVRDWAVGQAVAATNLLDQLLDDKAGWNGIFPELVLFDCHACHRRMDDQRWAPRPGVGLGPGYVRLNDSNLAILRLLLGRIDPPKGGALGEQIKALHRATLQSREATLAAARTLRATVQSAIPGLESRSYEPALLRQVLEAVLADARRGEYQDYAAAEQAAMAVQSLIVAFETSGRLDEAGAKAMQARVDQLYKHVEDGDQYRPDRFVESLSALVAAAP